MDSRGFGALPVRTYYRTTTFRQTDAIFAVCALGALAATMLLGPVVCAFALTTRSGQRQPPTLKPGGRMTSTPTPARTLTADLWDSAVPVYQQILQHPFLTGLTDGSLPEECFRFYVKQDSLYLREYARCLALASAKAPASDWCEMFAAHAQSALNVERSLHEGYFAGLGPDSRATSTPRRRPRRPWRTPPTCCGRRTRAVRGAVGAMLPCYWIYWEVGKTPDPGRLAEPVINAGSTPTPRSNSRTPSSGCWTPSSVRRRTSRRAAWPRSGATTLRPAATSGCSGTQRTDSSPGRSEACQEEGRPATPGRRSRPASRSARRSGSPDCSSRWVAPSAAICSSCSRTCSGVPYTPASSSGPDCDRPR